MDVERDPRLVHRLDPRGKLAKRRVGAKAVSFYDRAVLEQLATYDVCSACRSDSAVPDSTRGPARG